jgi:hypothetical protein
MGDERFNAVKLLGKALTEKQWPINKLKPNLAMTKETLASLEANSHVAEVSQF